jgi:hypothetical protein
MRAKRILWASVASTAVCLSVARGGELAATVTNPGKSDVKDYTLKLDIDDGFPGFWGEVRKDGGDMRFRGPEGEDFSYWVESFSHKDKTATVWVKVPLLPKKGEAEIKLCWGGAEEESGSDGAGTFAFFDDFSGDLGKWTAKFYNGNGTAKIVNGWARVASQHGDFGDPGNGSPDTGAGLYVRNPLGDQDFVAEMAFRQQNWQTSHHGGNQTFQLREDIEKARCYFYMLKQGSNVLCLSAFYVEGPYHIFAPKSWVFRNRKVIHARLARKGSTYSFHGSEDGGESWSQIHSLKITKPHPYIGLCDSYQNGYTEFDWMRMWKVVSPEPTVEWAFKAPPADE